MLRFIPFLFLCVVVVSSYGQTKEQSNMLVHYEDSLKTIRNQVLTVRMDEERIKLNEQFLKILSNVLNQNVSYDYPFDSIPAIGNLRSPDNKFRIINWNLPLNDGTHIYYCFLQTTTKKKTGLFKSVNSHTAIQLVDESEGISSPQRKVLKPDNWYGALYYDIIPLKKGGKQYYTLLGWDGNNNFTTKKIIDVLHFAGNDQVKFGAPIFKINGRTVKRVIFEYSAEATITVQYDKKNKRIIYDHLSPMKDELKGLRQYYVPDMSFDALEYKKNKWVEVEDIDFRQNKKLDMPYNDPKEK